MRRLDAKEASEMLGAVHTVYALHGKHTRRR